MTAPSARSSRLAAAAASLLLLGAQAHAADLFADDGLRGSFVADSGYTSWQGVNFGASIGLSNLNSDFANATSSLIAYSLRQTTLENEFAPSNWATMPKSTTNSMQYGAFVGYNVQWNELVVGFDVGYNHPSSLESSASDSIARQVTTSDNVTHNVSITSSASLKLVDYATLRARAGYAIGQFLPYAMVGAAVGRFNYTASATTVDVWTPQGGGPTTFAPPTQTDNKNNAFAAGFVTGLGVDVALLPNVFLRAEWEYTVFAPVEGIRSQINTGRVGAGVRF